ncbi:MAG TPA: hypothetical protein VNO22_02885 [Planctomycetota bacterium]|nr:hypothetical protein [Planctomycetota bacterium]
MNECVSRAEALLAESRESRELRARRLQEFAREVGRSPYTPPNADKLAQMDADDRRAASEWMARIQDFLGECGPKLDASGRPDLVDALGAEYDTWAGVTSNILQQEKKLSLAEQALVKAGQIARGVERAGSDVFKWVLTVLGILLAIEFLRTVRE